MTTRNHTGHRIGASHHRAKLTTDQVARIRDDREQGLSYSQLAQKYGCGLSTARDICKYWTRYAS